MGKLDGKVAIVTGGTSGIGEAIATSFASEGATVVATGSTPASVDAAREHLAGIEVMLSDASNVANVRELVSTVKAAHGRVDVLVVNAGKSTYAAIADVDEAFYDRMFDVNTKGPFFLMKEAVEAMPDGGAIVLISSICHALGSRHQSVYCASKAALRSLGRTFAAELSPRGIRVNTISPGAIATPAWGKGGASEEQVAARQAQMGAKIPLGRVGLPQEIAAAALYLVADAPYTTGIDLPVDGGVLDIGNSSAIQL